MKILFNYILLATALLFSFTVSASEMGAVLGFIGPLLPEYIAKYPILGDLINIMLTARLIIKPIMSALLTIFKDKPSFTFLSFSEEVLGNKIYKTFIFIVDYLFSIKLPKKK